MTALFNLLGQEVLEELFIMEKWSFVNINNLWINSIKYT
jgi:hypothetical protein